MSEKRINDLMADLEVVRDRLQNLRLQFGTYTEIASNTVGTPDGGMALQEVAELGRAISAVQEDYLALIRVIRDLVTQT